MAELQHGAALAGYRIEALIGQGSTGSVYSAEEVALKRRVALKVLPPELARDERFRERFLRESRMAAALEHPHIVPIHAVGEADGVLFLAMRYVGGRDLAALLDRVGRLEPERAVAICGQVAAALDAAHAHDLVHRDVKPGNVLLTREAEGDFAYLCDFGLAKHGSSVTSLTGARDIVGTVGYLSPEQIDGLPVDGRTDVYALGCVLFQCLCGEPPYVRENELATILAHRSEPPPAVTDRRPELPDGLDVVMRAGARQGPRGAPPELRRARARGAPRARGRGRRARAAARRRRSGAAHVRVRRPARLHGVHARARRRGGRARRQQPGRDGRGARAGARRQRAAAARRRGAGGLRLRARARCATRSRCSGGSRRTGCRSASASGSTRARRSSARRTCTPAGSTARRGCARWRRRARCSRRMASCTSPGGFDEARYGLRRLERLKGFDQPVGIVEVHPGDTAPSRELRRRLGRKLRGRRPRARIAAVAALVAAAVVLRAGARLRRWGRRRAGVRGELDRAAERRDGRAARHRSARAADLPVRDGGGGLVGVRRRPVDRAARRHAQPPRRRPASAAGLPRQPRDGLRIDLGGRRHVAHGPQGQRAPPDRLAADPAARHAAADPGAAERQQHRARRTTRCGRPTASRAASRGSTRRRAR